MNDKRIKNYAQTVKQRNEERREARKPLFPNLAQAQAGYNASRGEKTLAQIREEQEAAAGEEPKAPGLSQATIEGMKALRATQEAQMAQMPQQPAQQGLGGTQVPQNTFQPQIQAEAPKGKDNEEEEVDNADLIALLREMRQDPLNNERERMAVKDRVKELDIGEGLLSGEWTQVVPVIPEKLRVTYRSMSNLEHQALRIKMFKAVAADPELARMAEELLGFYQTVASVKAVNETVFPHHLKRTPAGAFEFLDEIFDQKLAQFQNYPVQLMHALGVHGAWFDARVRELFITADPLKNG